MIILLRRNIFGEEKVAREVNGREGKYQIDWYLMGPTMIHSLSPF